MPTCFLIAMTFIDIDHPAAGHFDAAALWIGLFSVCGARKARRPSLWTCVRV
jgi:hypothetical protein